MCFRKRKPRAIKKRITKIVLQMIDMFEWASKLPQNYMFLEWPQPGMLLFGNPGEVKWYEWHSWTTSFFCDLGQQADLSTKNILVLRRWQKKKKNMTFNQDIPHAQRFVPFNIPSNSLVPQKYLVITQIKWQPLSIRVSHF